MRYFLSLLICFLLFAAGSARAAQADEPADGANNCRQHGGNMNGGAGPPWCKNGDVTCSPEQRGRCGKRRGDWYGARQPVATAADALMLLQNYFSGKGYTVSGVTEKKWGFRADILDTAGKVVDRVMIDKRSGRIRSLY